MIGKITCSPKLFDGKASFLCVEQLALCYYNTKIEPFYSILTIQRFGCNVNRP